MSDTVRLGSVAGVRIGAHWSVLGIVVVLVVILARGVLPSSFPGESGASYVLTALVAAALFVLSLLAHEVGHAIVAVRNGIDVGGITLWLLGGVARLQGEPSEPGRDFRIAAVGPLISASLGGAFLIAAWLAFGAGAPDLVVGALSYLGTINILLASFNLIPAAPLDGGRILRAAIWAWRGDRHEAQIWSSRTGRVLGLLLIGLGLVALLSDYGGGLWWILVGLFIVTMASAEENYARAGAILGGLRARDIMTPNPEVADPRQSVAEFLQEVAITRRHSAFPLLGPGGGVQGLLTLNRISGLSRDRQWTTTVGEIACPIDKVPVVRPEDLVSDILVRMDGCPDGRALVIEDGRLVGIISPSDISRAISLRSMGTENFSGTDLIHASTGR